SVGHAGASAYLAAMALFGVRPAAMKPAALVMNIVVASAGTARWWSAGLVPWELLWPLCAGSVPAAFAGGAVVLPAEVYRRVLASSPRWRSWAASTARGSARGGCRRSRCGDCSLPSSSSPAAGSRSAAEARASVRRAGMLAYSGCPEARSRNPCRASPWSLSRGTRMAGQRGLACFRQLRPIEPGLVRNVSHVCMPVGSTRPRLARAWFVVLLLLGRTAAAEADGV